MLGISFHSADGQSHSSVEVSEDFYLWLARSEFSRIGKSRQSKIQADGEAVELPLVRLGKDNRRKLASFFRDEIIRETDTVLTQLGDTPSKELYHQITYRLKKLQELRKYIENGNYQYLQRV